MKLDKSRAEQLAAEIILAKKSENRWNKMCNLLRVYGLGQEQINQIEKMAGEARIAMKAKLPEMKEFQTQWYKYTVKIAVHIRSLS